jgi:murein L,D-transpeptidase YafK
MPSVIRIVLLIWLLGLGIGFSLEPAWTKSQTGLFPNLPAVTRADSSREMAPLKSIFDYVLACLTPVNPKSSVESDLVAARTMLKQKNFSGTLMYLDGRPGMEPDSVKYAENKAGDYIAAGKPGLAIPYLEWAASLGGDSPLRRKLAEAYKGNGEFFKAILEYEKLLSTEADSDWIRQQIIDLTQQKLLAAESRSDGQSASRTGLSNQPEPLLLMAPDSRCAIVEKESQTLFLYHGTSNGYELEKTFACSTGARPGEKIARGDERTPEGIYFLRMILPWTQLPEAYGRKAITLDYPNAVDRLEGKGGDGIWLHASNEPLRAYLPNKTRGCIVVSNEDIEDLSNLLILNQTPMVIVPRIRYRTASDLHAELDSIESFLSDWRSSWESRSIDRYISFYSTRFRNGVQDLNSWKAVKEDIFIRTGRIRLNVNLHSIVQNDRYAIATFHQDYESDRHTFRGTKRLFIVREHNQWKIISEEAGF